MPPNAAFRATKSRMSCDTRLSKLAPGAGFEPATNRLTAGCSTAELSGINGMRAYRRVDVLASPVAGLIVRTPVFKQSSNMDRGGHIRVRSAARLFADDRLQVLQPCCYTPSRVRDAARPDGLVAEWLRRGLQILVRGFDSLRGLQLFPMVGHSGRTQVASVAAGSSNGLASASTGALGACVFEPHRTKPRCPFRHGPSRSRRPHDR